MWPSVLCVQSFFGYHVLLSYSCNQFIASICAAVAVASAEESKVFYIRVDSTSWGDYCVYFGQFYFGFSLSILCF